VKKEKGQRGGGYPRNRNGEMTVRGESKPKEGWPKKLSGENNQSSERFLPD